MQTQYNMLYVPIPLVYEMIGTTTREQTLHFLNYCLCACVCVFVQSNTKERRTSKNIRVDKGFHFYFFNDGQLCFIFFSVCAVLFTSIFAYRRNDRMSYTM